MPQRVQVAISCQTALQFVSERNKDVSRCPPGIYSYRSATNGSMRAALLAGR